MKKITIATRKSNLALWQAKHVAALIEEKIPGTTVELLPLSTKGDEILDRSLQKVGGKGLFIKELEEAMLRGEADIAVHSMKDVPGDMPSGFCIEAVLPRAEPYDALVSQHKHLMDLPPKAVIGTSSQRRAAQILAMRPDVIIKSIRGNVETRLSKWRSGEYAAIILAQAGLVRLGLESNITQVLNPNISLPAVAQGIIGIECQSNQETLAQLLTQLNDVNTQVVLSAERAFNQVLGGDCHSPIAAFAEFKAGGLHLSGLVAALDGQKVIRVEKFLLLNNDSSNEVRLAAAMELGKSLGEEALALGAQELLQ